MSGVHTPHRPATPSLRPRDWLLLAVALPLIAILSQGAHDLAINRLGIPYPFDTAVPVWAKYVGQVTRFTAAVLFCRHAAWWLDRRSPAVAAIVTGALIAAASESLRRIVMDWVVVDGTRGLNWLPVLAAQLPKLLMAFYEGAVALLIARTMKGTGRLAVSIGAASALGYFVLLPALQGGMDAIVTRMGAPDPVPLYLPPYGWYVRSYIYVTFLEPVFAVSIMAALLWPSLERRTGRPIGWFVLFLLLLEGRIASFFLFSFWIAQPFPLSFLAEGQFFAETFILAALTGLLWRSISKRGAYPLHRQS